MHNRIVKKWTDEQLIQAVKKASNFREVLRLIGLKNVGGNAKTIKYWITEYKLDTSHWTMDARLAGLRRYTKSKETQPNEAFVENSTTNRSTLKQLIKRHNLLLYKCDLCGNVGIHNNSSLSLQLDHRNGINDDNRLENLRWLCPNCHSQTDTFCGRSKQSLGTIDNKPKCKICYNVISSKKYSLCRLCEDNRKRNEQASIKLQ